MNLDRSRVLYERSQRVISGGVNSNVRLSESPHPLFFESATGSSIKDVDGNEYIDYVLGQGPMIFGHSPQFLLKSVANASEKGQLFAGQHELEIQVAEVVQRIVPCAELVRFASSGTEVVQAALRVARAFTARDLIVKFEGHYHGWTDGVFFNTVAEPETSGPAGEPYSVPMSYGMPKTEAANVIALPWNDIHALEKVFSDNGEKIAAVITEPVMCNTNCVLPKDGYLNALQRICEANGTLLIFDEVITGFRLAPGGAQEYFGVTPDLATYAKAMAGGYPLSMLAGRRDVMAMIGRGEVMHGGTANANVMSMAAGKAALERITDPRIKTNEKLRKSGKLLIDGLKRLNEKYELGMLVQGPGEVFAVRFTGGKEVVDYRTHSKYADMSRYTRFVAEMMKRGIRLTSRGVWFVSEAHSEEDIEATLSAAKEALLLSRE